VAENRRAADDEAVTSKDMAVLAVALLSAACSSTSGSAGGPAGGGRGDSGMGISGGGGQPRTGGSGVPSGGGGGGGSGDAPSGSGGDDGAGGDDAAGTGGDEGDGARDDAPVIAPAACAKYVAGPGAISAWVAADAQGQLIYKTLGPAGDRIMDFSHAGYRGGGVALPIVAAVETVKPSGGDDTTAIQAALAAVAQRPLTAGVRGAVLLAPGIFNLGAALQITASGVVLRGSGSAAGGTEIKLTGAPHDFIALKGTGNWATAAETTFTDAYVPSGARSFTVADAAGLAAGDAILIRRPVTAEWITLMGMDLLVRNGLPQTWLTTTTRLAADRVITAVAGNRITIDVPLADSYDAKYVPGTTVGKYSFAGRISEVGVEHLRVTAPVITAPISQPLYGLIQVTAVADGWLRDVVALETENSVLIDQNVKRFTVQDLSILRSTIADSSMGYPLEVQFNGSQILVLRTTVKGDNLYSYCTGARATGPNAVVNSTATGMHTRFEPHARWSTGLLADNVVHDDALNLVNRGTAGSGHGWAIGWGVLWNSAAANLDVQKPPGSMNWAIGSKGKLSGDGTFDSPGAPVTPTSLYLAQLCLRLGPQAIANLDK
jgi:hypothetical protein